MRRTVFILEQGVPEALEWESRDPACLWCVAQAHETGIIGIARLTPEGRIGRMAVLPSWRRRGVGSALLQAVLRTARDRGWNRIELSAQTHAMPFYARHGFVGVGPDYLDAGIPHQTMILESLS